MDKERFTAACVEIEAEHIRNGIGTYSEQMLHAVIKKYFESDSDRHEVRIGRYIADAIGENGITEIQTKQLFKLRNKLEAFLSCSNVTVVYPIAKTKYLIWRDPESGQTTKRRKSPKTGTVYDAFYELYGIKQLLNNKNLTFCILFVEIEEYKNRDGWSRDGKKGGHRYERKPISLEDELYFTSTQDYAAILPESLPEVFGSAELSACAGINRRTAQLVLNVLLTVNAIAQCGKRGNMKLYVKIRK